MSEVMDAGCPELERHSIGRHELVVFSYPAREFRLTAAEAEVVLWVLLGEPNAAIAKRLGKSKRTIANQLSHAYRKLGVHSRGELVVRCIRPTRGAPR